LHAAIFLQRVVTDVDALHENEIPRLLWGETEDPDGEGLVIDENGGLVPLTEVQSWNSAHDTASCTEQGLAERRGAGRFYCFAID